MRQYSLLDQLLIQIQNGLETITGEAHGERANPAAVVPETSLTATERKQSVGYMRVNHSGEICAQALYRGQQITARNDELKTMLATAAREETDHLAWCQERIQELSGHPSYLNLFWYTNAFFIGTLAGFIGDGWSLGFVTETEKQVEAHLAGHLKNLPLADHKSRCIVTQMQQDEIQHGNTAKNLGAKELPEMIKKLMFLHAKMMTTLSYYF